MKRSRGSNPLAAIDALAALAAGFDFQVDAEDFILYEIARAIEEDRASLEDPEFQQRIDEGIREHVGNNLMVRAALAGLYRAACPGLAPEAAAMAGRLIAALEDLDSDLCHAAAVVRSYTGYLFRRLDEATSGTEEAAEESARGFIAQWQSGGLLTEQMVSRLTSLGRAAAPAAADLLFETLDDPGSAAAAVSILGGIHAPVAARTLAHAISEPMLDETVEHFAFAKLRGLWPLPRHYMLLALRRHEHEDLPVRWFQLLAECGDNETVDRMLEEVVRHAGNPAFHEDLVTILQFLPITGDPETTGKIIDLLNDPRTPMEAVALLEEYLKGYAPNPVVSPGDPWGRRAIRIEVHARYRAAARLADEGRLAEASAALDEILDHESGYPFAVMLKRLLVEPGQSPARVRRNRSSKRET